MLDALLKATQLVREKPGLESFFFFFKSQFTALSLAHAQYRSSGQDLVTDCLKKIHELLGSFLELIYFSCNEPQKANEKP